jgi:NitT/TauT family transport system substrate-binding protein
MQISPTRRDFLTSLPAAGVASVLVTRRPLAGEPPPETTTIRLRLEDAPPTVVSGIADNTLCIAPQYVAKELLSAEGFTDIRYVPVKSGLSFSEAFARGEIDFAVMFAPGAVLRLDAGVPITVLAGVHSGCFELFGHGPIRTVTDLKGKQVGINEAPGSTDQLYVSMMVTYVGLDPQKDINWVTTDDVANPMELFVQGKIDAYLAFVPEPQELRARKVGRVVIDMARDKPWSDYFCCILVGYKEFVRNYPVATKRALRAILKATDLCATEPERAARWLVEGGFSKHYNNALQVLTELPYNVWRELDPEDSLRFYALWLHDVGQLNSTPNQLIAEGTDWRFLNELKRELKA